MLQPCSAIYGGTRILTEKPPFQVAENVIFLPESPAGEGAGLFYSSGRAVAESLAYRGIPASHTPLGAAFTERDLNGISGAPESYDYFYLGDVNLHYGHFLIGALSRLWALPVSRRRKLRLVFKGQNRQEALFEKPYMRQIWKAFGLKEENFAFFPEGISFKKIAVPGAAFEENSHVYRIYAEMMQKIGDKISPHPAETKSHRIIYFTKEKLSHGIWRMRDEALLTQKLSALGVEIVSPENLSLADQIKLWQTGDIFIGTSGSSLHSSAFVSNRKLIVLNNVPEIWSNQVLIDKVSENTGLYLYDPDNFNYIMDHQEGFAGHLEIKDMDRLASELLSAVKRMRADSR